MMHSIGSPCRADRRRRDGAGRSRAGLGQGMRRAVMLSLLLAGAGLSTAGKAHLQCVPYAREVSGIAIHGDAATWWGKAQGRYPRGHEPSVGAVLAFRPTAAMPRGHVAVVAAIIDARHIMLDHANWSGPGRIERQALAEDVSAEGDWSAVRVWYAPIQSLGARENPTFGFIYEDLASEPERLIADGAADAPTLDAAPPVRDAG